MTVHIGKEVRCIDTILNSLLRIAVRDFHSALMPILAPLLRPKLVVPPYGSSRDNSRDICILDVYCQVLNSNCT